MSTIIVAVCGFLLENQAAITSSLIASASYDTIKKVLNFSSLKEKISRFFIDEEQIEKYLQKICEEKSNNPRKPERDIEDIYENITQSKYNSEIFENIKEWVMENKNTINETMNMSFRNESGFNIGVQNAKEIYNIRGDYNVKQN
jgi:hypothetical protein